jgi:nitrogen fixation NifU-like protein
MTTEILGKSADETRSLKDAFIALLTSDAVSDKTRSAVGKLKFFEGVKQFPIRVKCATLIWRALEEALKETPAPSTQISTE